MDLLVGHHVLRAQAPPVLQQRHHRGLQVRRRLALTAARAVAVGDAPGRAQRRALRLAVPPVHAVVGGQVPQSRPEHDVVVSVQVLLRPLPQRVGSGSAQHRVLHWVLQHREQHATRGRARQRVQRVHGERSHGELAVRRQRQHARGGAVVPQVGQRLDRVAEVRGLHRQHVDERGIVALIGRQHRDAALLLRDFLLRPGVPRESACRRRPQAPCWPRVVVADAVPIVAAVVPGNDVCDDVGGVVLVLGALGRTRTLPGLRPLPPVDVVGAAHPHVPLLRRHASDLLLRALQVAGKLSFHRLVGLDGGVKPSFQCAQDAAVLGVVVGVGPTQRPQAEKHLVVLVLVVLVLLQRLVQAVDGGVGGLHYFCDGVHNEEEVVGLHVRLHLRRLVFNAEQQLAHGRLRRVITISRSYSQQRLRGMRKVLLQLLQRVRVQHIEHYRQDLRVAVDVAHHVKQAPRDLVAAFLATPHSLGALQVFVDDVRRHRQRLAVLVEPGLRERVYTVVLRWDVVHATLGDVRRGGYIEQNQVIRGVFHRQQPSRHTSVGDGRRRVQIMPGRSFQHAVSLVVHFIGYSGAHGVLKAREGVKPPTRTVGSSPHHRGNRPCLGGLGVTSDRPELCHAFHVLHRRVFEHHMRLVVFRRATFTLRGRSGPLGVARGRRGGVRRVGCVNGASDDLGEVVAGG